MLFLASSASQKIASDKISEHPELKEKIILNHVDDFVKKRHSWCNF